MDGWIRLGTKLETKEFDAQIKVVEKRLKESKQQGIDEIIIRMLEMNMPKHQIVEISGMTMEYIEKLNIKKDGEQ